ncbi:MAG: hypothetical protein WAL71_01275 [Terriglobales bacterium]|jgi:hypothetical protein
MEEIQPDSKLDLVGAQREYVSMYVSPLTMPQKVGAIFSGLVAGAGVVLATSATLCLVGIAASEAGNAGWIHLGEYQPWLPIIGLEQGFLFGLVLGAIVCWRVWRSRLGRVPSE